jgi:hypothetical protein
MCAVLGTFWSQAGHYRDDPYGLAKPPFTLDPAAWRSVLLVAATKDASCPASVPIVVLYVSASCPHCQAELQRWSTLLHDRAPQARCIGFAVAATPGAGSANLGWVPRELLATLLWDHDATVAHALQARLVPLTAYVTKNGVVVARTVGETSPHSVLSHLDELRRASNSNRGAP